MASRTLAAALVLAAALLTAGCPGSDRPDPELAPLSIGGDFVLTGPDGKPFDSQQLRGKAFFLFFGFTHCPDVCPTTLSRLAKAYELLEDPRVKERIQTVFVSVDPERDTPEKLSEYLGYFAVPAVGLTGSPEVIAATAQKWGAFFQKVETDSAAGYLVDHSTYLYLVDSVGRVRHLFRHADSPERIADVTLRLLVRDCCAPPNREQLAK
jgi:protein SCO1